MKRKLPEEPYVNDILRGIQEALDTKARGAELIEVARNARRDQLRALRWDTLILETRVP